MQENGFNVEVNSQNKPVYLVQFAFITANNRSADAWSEQYQTFDFFTVEIDASVADVTDPADCQYMPTLNVTFDAPYIYYMIPM
jgi:hypothetical protein